MTDHEKIWNFQNLYKAHKTARKGKRDNTEVIRFEMNLSRELTELSQELKSENYRISGYYSFKVYEPKERTIHALHYRDRVVQHCICDEVLAPLLEPRLIYDNAACRIGKGTHFAMNRLCKFLHEFYNRHGSSGYFLKCDIRKFFDNIDHAVLKERLKKLITDESVLNLLYLYIDSYECAPGKGLPLGNQTSQWFALFYLDGLDRLVKEQLRIKYYSRYMDDCILICDSKQYLEQCRTAMEEYLHDELHLEFNEKTQIFPLKNGVEYLGFCFYLTDTGKVIRKVKRHTKMKFKRRLKSLQGKYASGETSLEQISQVLNSYQAHLSYGNTYNLRKTAMSNFVLKHN